MHYEELNGHLSELHDLYVEYSVKSHLFK